MYYVLCMYVQEPLNTAEWLVADVEYDEEEEEDQLISGIHIYYIS